MNTRQPIRPAQHRAARLTTLLLGLTLTVAGAVAAPADIAQQPLGTGTISAKPNLMFILDDSGSMGSEYMPDDMSNDARYGYYSAQCNGIAFDPDPKLDYKPPVRPDGTPYPNATYTAAWNDGWDSSAGTTNLATAVRNNGLAANVYYTYSGQQAPLNWVYAADGTLLSSRFNDECFSNRGSTPGSGVFTPATPVSAGDQQKYANWWSYYRKRYMLMRTAAGQAFKSLDSNYRVGFTVISDAGLGTQFLNAGDFDGQHRIDFYDKLYSAEPGGFTPLRGALSKIGRYYGNRITGQTDPAFYSTVDPVTKNPIEGRFQCQRNYALLSTDGYWNTNNRSGLPTEYQNGYQLDGITQVGNQDGLTPPARNVNATPGATPHPQRDGGSSTVTAVTETGTTYRERTVTQMQTRNDYSRTQYVITQLGNQAAGNCPNNSGNNRRYTVVRTDQTANQVSTFTNTLIEDVKEANVTTLITVDGTPGAPQTVGPTTTRTQVSNTRSNQVNGTQSAWAGSPVTTTCVSRNNLPGIANNSAGTFLDPNATGTVVTTGPALQAGTSAVVTAITDKTALPGNTTTTTVSVPGDSNTLADIAMYYYENDLRSDIDNKLKPVGRDTATWQHMTTYTVGLGVRGSLAYKPDYLVTPTNSDFDALSKGTKHWPVPSGTTGGAADATHVDDLWHAAVNGRGQYFSASNASDLVNAISTTLGDVIAQRGTASAAASSTLTPSASDDWLFLSRYITSPTWQGDLSAFKFTFITTGADAGTVVQPDTEKDTPVFSVADLLNTRNLGTGATLRDVWFDNAGAKTAFTYDTLPDALKPLFSDHCTNAPKMTQCATLESETDANISTLATDRLAKANSGTKVVEFLRGDRTLEISPSSKVNSIMRARTSRLGDIAHSSPVYVGKPGFKYSDAGYAAFVSANAGRDKVVYVGANDGMLHAFMVVPASGNTTQRPGEEIWAYVPTAAMPEMWRLADSSYDNNHRYYVDATPVVGDVFDGTNWLTILVGGLGGGGRGYFALDITDPRNPVPLWQFSDSNMGLSFGNPVITKNKDGTWVVAVTSGYNNTTGDGKGHLYILNAKTGAKLQEIVTTAGDATTPSNLGRINAWVVKDTNNTALRYYGGDMLGNLWRFDADDNVPPSGSEATLLGQALAPTTNAPQPITAMPLLTEITVAGGQVPLVSFGTGRYVGDADMSDTTLQSIYTVKDTLTATGLGVLRSGPAGLVALDMVAKAVANTNPPEFTRELATTPKIDWNTSNGWYVDLDISTRERIYLDGTPLAPGVIAFASTIPNGDPCSPAGESWVYKFNISSGALQQANHYSVPVVGLGRLETSTGVQDLITLETGLGKGKKNSDPPAIEPLTKRTSWRELID